MFRYLGMFINIAINLIMGILFLSFFTENDMQAFIIAIVLMLAYIGFTFTPLGVWLFRFQAGVRKPNPVESARIDPIYKHVYRLAKAKNPSLSSNIEWFMHDDNSLNAFACGPNTIGINVGLLTYCKDEEIAAVLAHEFAHIVHFDTTITTICVQSNWVANLIKTIFCIGINISGRVISFFIGFVSEEQFMSDIFIMITKLVNWVFNLYISAIYSIGFIASMASCRQQEFAADNYAAELGLAHPLINMFQKLPAESFTSSQIDIAHLLYGTHPKTKDRVARLQNYIDTHK